MKIAVIGGAGWLGGAIAREALARGHEVTVIGRDAAKLAEVAGATPKVADVLHPDAIAAAIAGHDVVVSSVTDRSGASRSVIPASVRSLLRAVPGAGVPRLAVVGGGGSLESEPGVRGIDRPDFPEAYRAEAEAQAEALAILRAEGGALDWTYLSPPPHDLVPGEKQGSYRVSAGDAPVADDGGREPHHERRLRGGDGGRARTAPLQRPPLHGRVLSAASPLIGAAPRAPSRASAPASPRPSLPRSASRTRASG